MKAGIWMPLYVADYLADTQHLSTEEHGAYMLLLMAYWQRGGPLPDNDVRLASIARASGDAWSMLRPVLEEFFEVAHGKWVHARVEAEIAATRKRSEGARIKAKQAADARWHKGKDGSAKALGDAPSNAAGNAPSIPQALLEQCHSQPHSQLHPALTTFEQERAVVARESSAGYDPPSAVQLSIAARKLGINTQPADPRLLAIASQGVALGTFEAACREALDKGTPPIGIGLVAAILTRWAAQAGKVAAAGASAPAAKDDALSRHNAEVVARWRPPGIREAGHGT